MPRGVRIVTMSPTCAFKTTVAISEIQETPPQAGSSSSTPTMLTVPSAPDSSATVGSDPKTAHRLHNVFCRAATKRCDRPQHDLAMAEEDAELFEIGLAQLGQYRDVDGIVAERLGVPLQREPAQPVGDPQEPSRSALPARLA
jgi:hypothetical protein